MAVEKKLSRGPQKFMLGFKPQYRAATSSPIVPATRTQVMQAKGKIQNWLAPVAMAGALFMVPTLCAADMDARIESAAKKSHVFKTYLKEDSIKVVSKSGVVTLTGSVADSSRKALAQDTVESLPGVTSVDNQLKIKSDGPAERSDAWVAAKVKSTLLFRRNVSGGKTDVQVTDGVVTLSGEASSAAQKELATEYARDVEGVKEVRNNMRVGRATTGSEHTLGEKIDDASITAQVKASLLAHRSTRALKTKVQTRDGVVTITGVAGNAAEKSLVTEIASDVNGVVSVINKMSIELASTNN